MAPRPNYGAIGGTFVSVRALQVISMLTIIGITSNFISEMVNANLTAPQELIGTLSVVCIGIVYCIVTAILYVDNILPFIVSAALDGLILIALIVVSVVVGKPLTYLNCRAIGDTDSASSAWDLTTALEETLNQVGGMLYIKLVDTSKSTCLQMKAVWGLAIALCVLFTFSTLCSVFLWRRKPVLMKEMMYGGA